MPSALSDLYIILNRQVDEMLRSQTLTYFLFALCFSNFGMQLPYRNFVL